MAGDGDGRRKVESDSFDKGRARSTPAAVSWRGAGTGEVGRLEGRKKDVGLRAYIADRSQWESRSRSPEYICECGLVKAECGMRLYVYECERECVARISYDGAGDLDPTASVDEFSP